MRWLLALIMALSLWTEAGAVSWVEGEVKRSCCCGHEQPICPPARTCSTVTVVPRVLQERAVTQSVVKIDLKTASIPLQKNFSSGHQVLSLGSNAVHLTWSERFPASVSLHDYWCLWLT
jgi:hypothetical protein